MKMRHVTIHTAKLEESVKFYEGIAGLKIQAELRGKGPHDIVFLANDEGETCVELLEDPDGAYGGDGLSIGFEAEDTAAYREELITKGMEVTPLISPNPQVTFFFTKDPNGVEIQFI